MKPLSISAAALLKIAATESYPLGEAEALIQAGDIAQKASPVAGLAKGLMWGLPAAGVGALTGLFARSGEKKRTAARNAILGALAVGIPAGFHGAGQMSGMGKLYSGQGEAMRRAAAGPIGEPVVQPD